ncbi:MAG: YcgN family cysteine cluster protein [Beijerinckiaceae bacterium]
MAGKLKSAQIPAASQGGAASADPFWKKPLEELNRQEWEALCDGCGRCCLVKLEDEDTAEIHYTNIVCRLFEARTCRCADYPNRRKKVPDCIVLSMKNVHELRWLPPTCAYKLRAEGKDLPFWHPLVSGSPESVHQAGISVRSRAGPSEDEIPLDDYPDYIVRWPANAPKGRRQKK